MTHYEIFGVPDTAGIEEIRSAYRKLAVKLHPDRNPGDQVAAEKFSKISAAYQVLSDPRTREVYDRERRRTTPRPARQPNRWGSVPIQAYGNFQRGPIQVMGGFPMEETTVIVVNGVAMPGVKVFRTGSATSTTGTFF